MLRSTDRPLRRARLLLVGAAAAANLVATVGSRAAQRPAPGPGESGLSASLVAWPEGPVRWLLLPHELREYRALRADDEAFAFIRAFWQRRDPRPETEVNELADEISRRIEMADRLYGEGDVRGSLTDRGGALLLLGPPSYLRASRRRLPALGGTSGPGTRATGAPPATRSVEMEEWGYGVAELPPRLEQLAPSLVREERAMLVFQHGETRTVLREGRSLLALAARALVRSDAAAEP